MGKSGIGDGRLITTYHVQGVNASQMSKSGIGDGRLIATLHVQGVQIMTGSYVCKTNVRHIRAPRHVQVAHAAQQGQIAIRHHIISSKLVHISLVERTRYGARKTQPPARALWAARPGKKTKRANLISYSAARYANI